jgi:2-succinyl-5-enolpyruvyl-6-hydroxy-3-cyclohexene-1-carboxylate synthase
VRAPSDLHSDWAALFARGLATSGVRDVVASPGSRSTPLAIAFAREAALRIIPVVDERSAAFFALGQARATGRPTVLVCTSGTAGAHYLPAIVEASQAFVPLLVVTADRPWELADAAAPQTIDQTKLFGDHVRHFAELGLPDVDALPAVLRIAAQAVSTSLHPVPGPVHVNARFRKPLEPVRVSEPEDHRADFARLLGRGAPTVCAPPSGVSDEGVRLLVRAAEEAERGVVVCGPSTGARFADPREAARLRTALGAFAEAAGFPIFAEATSQARFGREVSGLSVPGLDALLRAGGSESLGGIDLVVEVFSPPTSGGYAEVARRELPRIVLAEHGHPDPHGTASLVVLGDPVATIERAARLMTPRRRDRAWLASVLDAGARVDASADDAVAEGLSEASIARMVVSSLPDDAALVLGNSLPVRDVDTFGGPSARRVRVLHQRGASGIDGLVAGAAGARSAIDAAAPVVLLLGDVSARHDLGSFALLGEVEAPLVVVVVQNGGGRIFEELPVARDPALHDVVARLFVTPAPRGQDGLLGAVCGGAGVAYVRASDRAAFERALGEGLVRKRATVVEAVVAAEDGRERRAAHVERVRRSLVEGPLR